MASSSDQRPPFRVCLKSILVLSPHRALFGFTYLVMFLLPSFILIPSNAGTRVVLAHFQNFVVGKQASRRGPSRTADRAGLRSE